MTVSLSKNAAKYLARLNEPDLSRVMNGLAGLAHEPPEGDIKKLTDRDEYRLRVGGYRILFKIEEDIILVTNITTRGHAY